MAAAEVQRLPVGADDHPADVAVAGQPAGPGGGDPGTEPGGAAPGPVAGSTRSVERDRDDDVRLDGAQDRQAAGGEGVVAQLHEGVAELLGAGAGVPGGPVGLRDRLQRGLHLLPADGVELEPAGHAAVGVLWRCVSDRPSVGSGSGPSGSSRGQVVLHHLRQPAWGRLGGDGGQRRRRSRRGRCPARRRRQVVRRGDGRDDGDLLGGDVPAVNAAATAGRCAIARPLRTSPPAAAATAGRAPAARTAWSSARRARRPG